MLGPSYCDGYLSSIAHLIPSQWPGEGRLGTPPPTYQSQVLTGILPGWCYGYLSSIVHLIPSQWPGEGRLGTPPPTYQSQVLTGILPGWCYGYLSSIAHLILQSVTRWGQTGDSPPPYLSITGPNWYITWVVLWLPFLYSPPNPPVSDQVRTDWGLPPPTYQPQVLPGILPGWCYGYLSSIAHLIPSQWPGEGRLGTRPLPVNHRS